MVYGHGIVFLIQFLEKLGLKCSQSRELLQHGDSQNQYRSSFCSLTDGNDQQWREADTSGKMKVRDSCSKKQHLERGECSNYPFAG